MKIANIETEDIEIKDITANLLREILSKNDIKNISDINIISKIKIILEAKDLEIKRIIEKTNKKLEKSRIKMLEKDEQLEIKNKRINELMIEGQDWVDKFFELKKIVHADESIDRENKKLKLSE